jgi:hypothetical protein
MNVMYFGIPNPIDVSVPGVSPDKIRIRVVNGSFSTEKVKNSKGENFRGNYSVKPEAAGKAVQIIVSTEDNGKTTTYAPYDFRVKPIPKPEARFGGKTGGTITKAQAAAQAGVFAVLPDFDFDLQYTVTSFTVLFSDRMGDFEEPSTNSNLTAKQRELINRTTKGKYLTFKDIRALGPDGRTIDLNPVLLKIE